jgi:DDE family transposase
MEILSQAENLAGLARINCELIARAEALEPRRRVVLDMDSTEVAVFGEQEQSAYNGHFESTCYHPLPKAIGNWSLTSLQQRLVKTGGRFIRHARYYWPLLAEGHLTRRFLLSSKRSRRRGRFRLRLAARNACGRSNFPCPQSASGSRVPASARRHERRQPVHQVTWVVRTQRSRARSIRPTIRH